MSLHMVRIAVQRRWLAAWAHDAGIPSDDEGYLLHAAMRAAFGAAAPQPWVARAGDRGREPIVLGYGAADEAALGAALELPADPLLAKVFDPATIHSKPMPAAWQPGRRLAFEIRLCPIVRQARGPESRPRELDLFLWHCLRTPREPFDRESLYLSWLAKRLDVSGAELQDGRLTRLEQVPLVRRRHGRAGAEPAEGPAKRLRSARRPDATVEGTLRVADPARFVHLIVHGVGRHRAFGFGMLLLRPA